MNDNHTYPLLNRITELYNADKGNFDHVYILACQHILVSQAKMFELIHNFGIPKQNMHVFGKVYSTNKIVLQQLIDNEFNISEHTFKQDTSFDIQHAENCKREFVKFIHNIKPRSRIIILDDGGELLKTVHENFDLIPDDISVFGIEQTSSGFRKLEHSQLYFPIFNVARSNTKLNKESPVVASIGYNRIIDVFKQYLIEPRILVVGLGPIGKNIFLLLKQNKYFTIGYDTATHTETNLIDLILKNNINVVVGTTGKNILDAKQIQKINETIKTKLYLISMSSADREFDTVYIKEKQKNIQIHSDLMRGNIILINNGFPITFKGNPYESAHHGDIEIERTIATLYGSVIEAAITIENINPGFIDIPSRIKFKEASKNISNIQVKLLLYSESIPTQKRLATFTIKIPKFLWGHIISHRVLSRNSASSRAIPAKRLRKTVLQDPFLPVYFGENKPGMQSGKPLTGFRLFIAQKIWLWSRYIPIMFHYLGEKIGIHKEVINRMIEPWLMVDIIVTASEWNNFITLRTNEAAQPEIRYVAEQIEILLRESIPQKLKADEWHLPFISKQEKYFNLNIRKKISAARCARVSYSLFDGKNSDVTSDLNLCDKLSSSGHWSPFEYVAQALDKIERIGNFIGWKQFRKEFEMESGGDYR
jgi:thymidylate synthase ThyX/S-adenosylhomocysteine hydrolase